jgi:hypothetical protein
VCAHAVRTNAWCDSSVLLSVAVVAVVELIPHDMVLRSHFLSIKKDCPKTVCDTADSVALLH